MAMACSRCGRALATGVPVCPSCGARTRPVSAPAFAMVICPWCGAATTAEQERCPSCDAGLGPPTPAVTPERAQASGAPARLAAIVLVAGAVAVLLLVAVALVW